MFLEIQTEKCSIKTLFASVRFIVSTFDFPTLNLARGWLKVV